MRKTKGLFKFIIIFLSIIILFILYINIRYPICYKDIIIDKSEKYDLDPYLVASIINVESSYESDALSIKDAKGLMQISPQTGKWASQVLDIKGYKEEMLFNPEINIEIGTWYLNRLFKEFDQDLDLVLMAYNAGSGNVNKWLNNEEYCEDGKNINNIPFTETRNYVQRISKNYKIYKLFYGEKILNTEKNHCYINIIRDIKNTLKSIVK